MMRTRSAVARRVLATLLGATLLGACSSTGEPGHTAAVDVVRVEDDGITQTVVPAGDGFDRVTVTVATFGEVDGVDGTLELTVAGAGEERRAAAEGADLVDNTPLTLAFAPVDDAAGRTFAMTFRYEGAEPLALYRNPYDPYRDGSLEDEDGDLVFTLGHADRIGGAVAATGRSAREAAHLAGADPGFLVLWLGGLGALAGAALALSRRGGAHRAPRDRAAGSR